MNLYSKIQQMRDIGIENSLTAIKESQKDLAIQEMFLVVFDFIEKTRNLLICNPQLKELLIDIENLGVLCSIYVIELKEDNGKTYSFDYNCEDILIEVNALFDSFLSIDYIKTFEIKPRRYCINFKNNWEEQILNIFIPKDLLTCYRVLELQHQLPQQPSQSIKLKI